MKILKLSATILLLLGLLNSCASGPKPKSALNYLNGENYSPGPGLMIGSIPVNIRSKDRSTVVRGECFFKKSDDFKYPVKFKKLSILKDNRILQDTTTDASGNFSFNIPLENDNYTIRISDNSYNGEMPVTISGYLVEGLSFKVQKSN